MHLTSHVCQSVFCCLFMIVCHRTTIQYSLFFNAPARRLPRGRVFDREWNGTEVSAVSDSCQRHVKVYIQDKLWNTASYYAFCKVYEGWQQICPVWLSCSNVLSYPFVGLFHCQPGGPVWLMLDLHKSLTDVGYTSYANDKTLFSVAGNR